MELTRAAALGNQVWIEARATNDFAKFLPALQRNLELKRRYVECFEWDDSPYTPLLDDFEPYMLTSEVADVFATIRPVLSELVREAPRVDASFLRLSYPVDAQVGFYERILATLGLEEGSYRLDPTVHPFCTSFSRRDVRMTTRFESGLDGLWSTMHEAGHGHYAHGIAPSLERTPLAGSPSLGLNESQSRTWENLVGRSRPFWLHWYEPLQETFPSQLGDVDLESFLTAVNRAEPGLIRVEADETTYSLHIILRFELEQQLIEGSLDPKDLPEAWNAGMADLLGVEVPDDTHGVLQDIHWSQGGIGYFPTYALGNVISLQIWAVVREAIPDLDAQMEAGELGELAAVAPRQPVFARPQVHAQGDDRAADRNADDRPAAVPRIPPREARLAARRCLTPSRWSSTASPARSRSRVARCSSTRCATGSGSREPTSAATRASAARAPSCSTAAR